jgi:hypothetical protein
MDNEMYVVVCMFQGLIDDVNVFTDEKKAEKRFEEYTEVSWKDYENDTDILNNTNEEQTNIYKVQIKY